MATRISSAQVAEGSIFGIMSAYSHFDEEQSKINTGKQVQKPSDDPSGVAQSLNFRERVSEIDQYGKTMDQATGFMSTTESALGSISDLLRQARTIGVQGASDNVSVETRTALANQIQNIMTQIGNIGNTTFGARYVFGGQKTTVAPFVGAGSSFNYVGGTAAASNDTIILDIGRSEPLQVNVSGDKVISPILTALGNLRDDIAFGNSQTISGTDLDAMDSQINNVLGIRADLGSKIQRVNETQQRNALSKVNFTKFISDIEDTDMAKAVVDFQTAQTTYQAAVGAAAKVLQLSLLNFLN